MEQQRECGLQLSGGNLRDSARVASSYLEAVCMREREPPLGRQAGRWARQQPVIVQELPPDSWRQSACAGGGTTFRLAGRQVGKAAASDSARAASR